MQDLNLGIDPVDLVICGRYDETDEGHYKPDAETERIIEDLRDRLHQRELYPYADINFCDCGSAYEYGPSITVLPEKVRYLDIDGETLEQLIDRHVVDASPKAVSD